MKLPFDENLSPKLVEVLVEDYPESLHVQSAELGGATDHEIWEFAKDRGFAIVSKDSDFRERSVVESFPPKIVWLDVGNSGTAAIAELLQRERPRIERFDLEGDPSLLILSIEHASI